MGLYDRQLAFSLAIAKIQTAADAKKLAIEGESVPRDPRSRRSLSNYIPKGEGEFIDDYLEKNEWLEEEEDITAAVGVLSSSKRNESLLNKPPERRQTVATSSRRCYGYKGYGHFRSDC